MNRSVSMIYDFPQMREIYALIEETFYHTDTLPSTELILDRVNRTFSEMFETLSDVRDGSFYEFSNYDDALLKRFTECINSIISTIEGFSHNVQHIVEIHLINNSGTTYVRYNPIQAHYRCYETPIHHTHTFTPQYAPLL